MNSIFWSLLARLLARPAITEWLIRRAKRTPYLHIANADCTEVYMERYWLLNPYDRKTNKPKWAPWFPWSIRIHHIHRADYDDHPHDHPWNARTFILKGWYEEVRWLPIKNPSLMMPVRRRRVPGKTAELRFGDYHQIAAVGPEGAVTLFITGPYQGTWGFLVDGIKVQWKKYLGIPEEGDLPPIEPKVKP